MIPDPGADPVRALEIRVEEQVPLAEYPQIKCNISRARVRIYHLPFDQQCDATVITPDTGEQWVQTVVEAEAVGFAGRGAGAG